MQAPTTHGEASSEPVPVDAETPSPCKPPVEMPTPGPAETPRAAETPPKPCRGDAAALVDQAADRETVGEEEGNSGEPFVPTSPVPLPPFPPPDFRPPSKGSFPIQW